MTMKLRSIELKFPWLSEENPVIRIKKWLVTVGDTVEIDQDLAVMLVDNEEFLLPSPTDGYIKSIIAEPGEIIETDQALAEIDLI